MKFCFIFKYTWTEFNQKTINKASLKYKNTTYKELWDKIDQNESKNKDSTFKQLSLYLFSLGD